MDPNQNQKDSKDFSINELPENQEDNKSDTGSYSDPDAPHWKVGFQSPPLLPDVHSADSNRPFEPVFYAYAATVLANCLTNLLKRVGQFEQLTEEERTKIQLFLSLSRLDGFLSFRYAGNRKLCYDTPTEEMLKNLAEGITYFSGLSAKIASLLQNNQALQKLAEEGREEMEMYSFPHYNEEEYRDFVRENLRCFVDLIVKGALTFRDIFGLIMTLSSFNDLDNATRAFKAIYQQANSLAKGTTTFEQVLVNASIKRSGLHSTQIKQLQSETFLLGLENAIAHGTIPSPASSSSSASDTKEAWIDEKKLEGAIVRRNVNPRFKQRITQIDTLKRQQAFLCGLENSIYSGEIQPVFNHSSFHSANSSSACGSNTSSSSSSSASPSTSSSSSSSYYSGEWLSTWATQWPTDHQPDVNEDEDEDEDEDELDESESESEYSPRQRS